jgi:hypothetical protein
VYTYGFILPLSFLNTTEHNRLGRASNKVAYQCCSKTTVFDSDDAVVLIAEFQRVDIVKPDYPLADGNKLLKKIAFFY